MLRRRTALAALQFLCVAPGISAQTAKTGAPRRIGYLGVDTAPNTPPAMRPFYVAMRQKGWILGENLVREALYTDQADGMIDTLVRLAGELVRKRVDAILTIGDQESVAAARSTRTIPIVFFGVNFPAERGLIQSDARPGRNVTGMTGYPGTEVAYKRLSLLREVVPTATRLAWLQGGIDWSALETVAGGRFDLTAILRSGAKDLHFETRFHVVRTERDLDGVLADFVGWGTQAVVANDLPPVARQPVAELLLRHRLPSAFYARENVEAGGLMSYGAGPSDAAYVNSRLADYVDGVLRGTSPADLPVERPRRYDLVINMKTANALALTIPPSLLAQADEVLR